MYQGVSSDTLGDYLKKNMMALRGVDPNWVLTKIENSPTLSNIYPDNLILNTCFKDNYNTNIFLQSDEYSNEELVNYYKNLFNNMNWEVYYRDLSQSKEIKAIKAYVLNENIKFSSSLNLLKLIPTLSKKRKWNITFKWNALIEKYLSTKILDIKLLQEVQELKKNDQNFEKFPPVSTGYRYEFFNLLGLNDLKDVFFDDLYNGLINGNYCNNLFRNSKNYSELISYYSFLYHFSDRYYTEDEIINIAKAYGITYSKEDLLNRNNKFYYLDKIYFSPYFDYYNSNFYNELIETFIPWVINDN